MIREGRMSKRQISRGAGSDAVRARPHASAGERRGQALVEPSTRLARAEGAIREPPPRQRSVAMRLAEEVQRLESELASVRAQMVELAARANIDPLTDVLNRSAFERELRRSLAHAKRYGSNAALIYLDRDGFKSVNDRHGHGAGDAVLKATATVLLRHVRASDVVTRLGGAGGRGVNDQLELARLACSDSQSPALPAAVRAP
jgi:predicted signal transduction protein with EAL and GGDEF domain